jgi:amino acid adenylation domain-containing protein
LNDSAERLAKLSPEQRALLEERLEQKRGPAADPFILRPRGPGEPAVPSFSQERLWFLDQLEGASATYNICAATFLRGPLRVDCLKEALAEIVRRHDSLRTTLPAPAHNQPLLQQISEKLDFRLEEADLSATPAEQRENAARQMANEVARQPMSLAAGPLYRMRLIRLGPDNHALVVVIHHVISDAWSFDIFFRELSTLYANSVTGRKPSLAPLQIQYTDFAHWQRQRMQGDELKRQLSYWTERLAGIPPLLELPTDFPRPAEQSYRGATCERRIGPALTEKIHRLGRDTEGTPFMTLLAALSALLHRYSGQTDIAVGFPVTNRTRVELEALIGFFVNMLVLRADFSGDPTVRELIQQVRQNTLEAISHQELPFEKLVRELQPDRNLSHPPFFQVALMFQQDDQLLNLPGVTVEPIPINAGTAKFDLTLFASKGRGELRLWLEYATDLFKAQTAERLLAHFECLLESFVADPDLRVSRLNLLDPVERRQLLLEWNQTAEEYPRDKTIHALFEEQAVRTPDAPAVEFETDRLSYRELDRRAEALAAELRQLGVKLEDRVGLYVERSLDMVIGVLGILKAGAAYVPLDPFFPKDRLAFMAADAQMPVLVTQQRLVSELPEHSGRVVCLDALPPAPSGVANRPACFAENLAYVIYTSGSTGRPKGVQIPHRAVVNFLYSMRKAPGLRPEDVWLAITTLSFDIAGLELFLPLTTGAKVVIAARDVAADGPRLARLIWNSGATVMQATPATWRMLIESGWSGSPRLKILCGGEAIDPELAQRLVERCPEVWNMYGPTETTIWSTTERISLGQPITLGRPIANTRVYILDENFQPTPVAVVGELFIGGDGVARGYLDRPELSSERFVPDSFNANGPGRLYRTGDLVRFRSDGRIEFVGRADNQVKIRGFRIELGEIEAALARTDGVAQAVVIAREDTPGDKRLVAYVVPTSRGQASPPGANPRSGGGIPSVGAPDQASSVLNASLLRSALRQTLPEYMIPLAYVFLDALPLTPNGKVDRKALPPPQQRPELSETYEAPRGAVEVKLAGIMASLLKVPRVGRKDNFFDLGGHSILAVTFFNEIDRVFDQRLPLATLFCAPTIEHLAAKLESDRERTSGWASLVPIQTEGTKPRFFCIHGAGGNVLLYRDLVRRLGRDYPFFGLQAQGLDGKAPVLSTVEAMAEKYLNEIRQLQPDGPYFLGGYCLGGTIAYEMAQVLRRKGHQVALVALLDTYNFSRMQQPRLVNYLRQKTVFHLDNLARLRWTKWPAYFSNKFRVARDGELSSLLKTIGGKIRNKATGHSGVSIEASVQGVNDRAAEAYLPQPYSGRVTVFKPRVNYDFYPDAQMGWGDVVTGKLDIVELPVNPHAMLVEPYVQILADRLKDALERATARAAASSTTFLWGPKQNSRG